MSQADEARRPAAGVPVSPIDPFSIDFFRDPHSAHEALREAGPVVWLERDPRKWPHADRYDIDRSTAGHVGFGGGVHMCVGQLLARLEGEALLSAFARAFSTIEPDG